jgi:hypothetical protein
MKPEKKSRVQTPAPAQLPVHPRSFAAIAQRVPEVGRLLQESRSQHPRRADYCRLGKLREFRNQLRQLPLDRAEAAEVLVVLDDGLPRCDFRCRTCNPVLPAGPPPADVEPAPSYHRRDRKPPRTSEPRP